MSPLFSAEGEAALHDVVRQRAILVFDFDGTLAPIVDDPASAAMGPATAALLGALAARVPCAVVSGRARGDVAARVASVPLRAVVGNHGAEPGPDAPEPALRARVEGWLAALRAAVDEPGVVVEDKGRSLAVHVRRAARPVQALERAAAAAAALDGARVFGGKLVVNVVPEAAPTKADAVEALAAECGGAPVLYVGDDDTDEDAFRSRAVRWGVRVGRAERSAARFFVDEQAQVDRLLRVLAEEHGRVAAEG
jgi:trehalose 6-phosphate phosphatase